MAVDIEAALASHSPDDRVVRLVSAVVESAPGGFPLPAWTRLDDGAMALGLVADDVEAARARLGTESVRRAHFAIEGLDEGEDVVAILTGLGTSLRVYLSGRKAGAGGGEDALDQQQREDAATKLMTLAWASAELFGEGVSGVERLVRAPSGRAVLTWLAAIELVLPLSSEVVRGELAALLAAERPAARDRFAVAFGASEAERADAAWPALIDAVIARAGDASEWLERIEGIIAPYVPPVVDAVDFAGAVVAGAFDALPVYHLLAARLVAEAALIGRVETPIQTEAPNAAMEPPNESAAAEPVVSGASTEPLAAVPQVDPEPPVTPPAPDELVVPPALEATSAANGGGPPALQSAAGAGNLSLQEESPRESAPPPPRERPNERTERLPERLPDRHSDRPPERPPERHPERPPQRPPERPPRRHADPPIPPKQSGGIGGVVMAFAALILVCGGVGVLGVGAAITAGYLPRTSVSWPGGNSTPNAPIAPPPPTLPPATAVPTAPAPAAPTPTSPSPPAPVATPTPPTPAPPAPRTTSTNASPTARPSSRPSASTHTTKRAHTTAPASNRGTKKGKHHP